MRNLEKTELKFYQYPAWHPVTIEGVGRKAQEAGVLYIHVYIYNYDWFMLMYGRDHHHNVKQVTSNLKSFINKSEGL